MKNETTEERRSRDLMCVVLSGVFLLAGCTCVTVHINWPPDQQTARSTGPVAGGTFLPVAALLSSQAPGQMVICGTTIQSALQLNPSRTSGLGDHGFRGYVIKSNVTGTATIPNATYVLRATVSSQLFSCCTNVPTSEDPLSIFVGCTNSPNKIYRFKVYWKPGTIPAAPTDTIYLMGDWQP